MEREHNEINIRVATVEDATYFKEISISGCRRQKIVCNFMSI